MHRLVHSGSAFFTRSFNVVISLCLRNVNVSSPILISRYFPILSNVLIQFCLPSQFLNLNLPLVLPLLAFHTCLSYFCASTATSPTTSTTSPCLLYFCTSPDISPSFRCNPLPYPPTLGAYRRSLLRNISLPAPLVSVSHVFASNFVSLIRPVTSYR